ncbi:MAG: (2Fe-2S)-binding protein [Firmicutes bacterium]|nr:(2Fe-2S)-binding protein [Bacillota bacterium]
MAAVEDRISIQLQVNGRQHQVEVAPRWTLADVLRHQIGLTGTHIGCEQGVCGACTVLLDGEPVRSCLMFAVQAQGHHVTTVEGVTPETGLSPLQESFRDHHALQCGYCTPGMLLTAQALLDRNPTADEGAVREALTGNLCRCTGYQFIVDAVLAARDQGRDE